MTKYCSEECASAHQFEHSKECEALGLLCKAGLIGPKAKNDGKWKENLIYGCALGSPEIARLTIRVLIGGDAACDKVDALPPKDPTKLGREWEEAQTVARKFVNALGECAMLRSVWSSEQQGVLV